MKKPAYLSSLTSLRGIAALLVIFFHFDLIFFRLLPLNIPFFVRKGYLSVDFFFLLSGFIMMYVYGKSFSEGVNIKNYKQFIRARFARIYPLFLFSFLVTLTYYFWYKAHYALNVMDSYTFNLRAIPTNLLLLHSMNFHRYLSWDTPSWSISTEWWMYFLFPLIFIPFLKVMSWRKMAIFLMVAFSYLFIIYYLHPLSNSTSPFPDTTNLYSLDVTYNYGFFRCFTGFLFGMFIYELYKIKWGYSYLKKSSSFLMTTILTISALSFNTPDFIIVFLFALMLITSAYATGRIENLLNNKSLIFLGDISYSLYLMHMPILFFLLNFKNRLFEISSDRIIIYWLYCFMYVAIVTFIATLTYNFIEIPLRKKINRV